MRFLIISSTSELKISAKFPKFYSPYIRPFALIFFIILTNFANLIIVKVEY
ncbi:hypothetical protein OCHUTO_0309 [Orientia chuto str. Dubai]|uniref:Uncharacterized protein n=1 Tax=Orientia chuto str. Dubai TaxID=1359168 RepID=A0A0F3MQ76_9RICK|nr:hypothetical protein OCHUTO_0309 [Orientia chuto str. Dubai]